MLDTKKLVFAIFLLSLNLIFLIKNNYFFVFFCLLKKILIRVLLIIFLPTKTPKLVQVIISNTYIRFVEKKS